MKLRYFLLIIVAICLIFLLCACKPAITGMAIETYPDKLFYVISVDEELNLDGGSVYFLFNRDKDIQHYRQHREYPVGMYGMDVIHDIDFTKEGIYIVTIYRSHNQQVSFPIQVVSLDELEEIVNNAR